VLGAPSDPASKLPSVEDEEPSCFDGALLSVELEVSVLELEVCVLELEVSVLELDESVLEPGVSVLELVESVLELSVGAVLGFEEAVVVDALAASAAAAAVVEWAADVAGEAEELAAN